MFPNPSRAADARKIYPRLSATCASESDEATSCILIPTLVSHAHITSVDLVARRRSNGAFDSKDLSLLPPLYHKSLAHGIPSPMFPFSSLFYVTSPLRHSFIKRRRLRLTEDQVCQDTNLSRIGPSWISRYDGAPATVWIRRQGLHGQKLRGDHGPPQGRRGVRQHIDLWACLPSGRVGTCMSSSPLASLFLFLARNDGDELC